MANILIIDDEENFRKSIKLILEKQGHSVKEAIDGEEGLKLIQLKDNIDIVLMDVIMPKKGGVETLMDYKSSFKDKEVILMTGKVTPGYSFQNLATTFGVKHILYKPFKKNELLEIINSILK